MLNSHYKTLKKKRLQDIIFYNENSLNNRF